MTLAIISDDNDVANSGLDYILKHFEHQMQLWPRTITTKTTECKQVIVYSKQEAIARFRQANFVDCRISAYPYWRPSIVSDFVEIKNAIAPNFIMIDLDLCNFELDEDKLLHVLRQTLRKIKELLQLSRPTVIWSGNGYHIYIPIDAPILENIVEFSDTEQVSTKFIRFAESYLSNGKSDPAHNSTVSINNCMLRIPGSINSKNGATVAILKKSKSEPVSINLLIGSFCAYLETEKIIKAKEVSRWSNHNKASANTASPTNYYWIEKLLETPIPDCRRRCIWRIIAPYLINVRKLSRDESFQIISEWLYKCSKVRRLYFDRKLKINQNLKDSIKTRFYPLGISRLYATEKELAELLQKYGIFDKQV